MKAIVLGVALAISGCSVFTPANVERLHAAELAACFIAHAALPDSQAIATACSVGPDFTAMIEKIVEAYKAGVEKDGVCR